MDERTYRNYILRPLGHHPLWGRCSASNYRKSLVNSRAGSISDDYGFITPQGQPAASAALPAATEALPAAFKALPAVSKALPAAFELLSATSGPSQLAAFEVLLATSFFLFPFSCLGNLLSCL